MYQPVPFDGMFIYILTLAFIPIFAFTFISVGRKEKQRNLVIWGIGLAVVLPIVGFVGFTPASENSDNRKKIMESNVQTKYNNKYGDTYLREVVYNHPNSSKGSSGHYFDLTFEDIKEEVEFVFDKKTGEPLCYCELRQDGNPTRK